MPVRTYDELKKYFLTGNKPSQIWWNNFFDTLALVEKRAQDAYAVNGPVIVVANQAARLLIGPALSIGRQVKQSDNGVTYSKQVETGDDVADWVAIGDTDIQISDVNTLQTEIDNRINKAGSDFTAFNLTADAFWITSACDTASITDLGATERVNMNFDTGPGFRYTAAITKDFTIGISSAVSPKPSLGMSQIVLVKNNSGGGLSFIKPADIADTGSGATKFVLTNASSPLLVPDGKVLTISVLKVPIHVSDPDYPPASPPTLPGGGFYYFITVGLQS